MGSCVSVLYRKIDQANLISELLSFGKLDMVYSESIEKQTAVTNITNRQRIV